MPWGATFANKAAQLFLQAVPIANLADNAVSGPLTDLYISLHTDDPGAGGDQTTNEASYPGYARVAVSRDNTGFTDTGATTNPAADIVFPASTGGADQTFPYWMIGTASSGAGEQMFRGTITPNIVAINGGDPPTLTTDTQINFLTP